MENDKISMAEAMFIAKAKGGGGNGMSEEIFTSIHINGVLLEDNNFNITEEGRITK